MRGLGCHVGGAVLVLLLAAGLIHPAVWRGGLDPPDALRAGAGPWLPTALAAAALGGGIGALVVVSRRRRGLAAPAEGRRAITSAAARDLGATTPPAAREPAATMAWAPGLAIAALAGLAVAAIAGAAFHALPVHVDGVVQAFQGHILRSGALSAPAPRLGEFFVTLNTGFASGRWFGQFPPGFPALLAAAGDGAGRLVLHGALTALTTAVLYRMGATLYGRRVGLLAAALFAFNPFTLLVSASGLNHAAAAAAAVLAFWLALRGGTGALVGCGASLGALISIRPLDGAVLTVALTAYALLRGGVPRARDVVALAAGLLPPLVLLAAYNVATTGSPLELGYHQVWGPSHNLGFHRSPWGEPHTLVRGVANLHHDLWLLNGTVFGPALPLLPLAAVPFVSARGATSLMVRRAELCLAGISATLAVAYVAYWHHDWFLGPRYVFTAMPFLTLLIARGAALMASYFVGRPVVRGALVGAFGAGLAWLGAATLPARLGEAFALRPGFRVDVAREARAAGIDRGVVFVKESWGSRILARLRARGLSASDAEVLYRRADHCVLEVLLGDSTVGAAELLAAARADLALAPQPVFVEANGDPTLRLRVQAALAPPCRAQLDYDRTARYGAFTPQLATIDPWLRDPIVVARDLGAENARLLASRHEEGYVYISGPPGAPGEFVPWDLVSERAWSTLLATRDVHVQP